MKTKTIDIKRKDAARLIDEVAHFVALLEDGAHPNDRPVDIANRLRTILSTQGISIPRRCT